ncbi:MAG: phosphotransferase [Ornithinimicrobium sp.]
MSPLKRPAAEVSIDVALVTALVADQHSDLAHLPVVHEAGGWDNEIFRLGSEYAVRIPRRRMAAALIEHELAWLPELAPALPLPIPAPIRRGVPGCGYPWAWSIGRPQCRDRLRRPDLGRSGHRPLGGMDALRR